MKLLSSRWIKYFVSLIVSFIVIVYVFNSIEWNTLFNIFTDLNWWWLTPAWITFLFTYLLRTLRFRAIIAQDEKLPLGKLFAVTTLHGMFNYLLPGKTGELSFPILLNRQLKVSLTGSAVTLVAARFFDFLTIAMFLPFVLALFWASMPPPLIYGSMIFCAAIYIFSILLFIWLQRTKFEQPSITTKALNFGQRLVKLWKQLSFELHSIYQKERYGYVWLLTVLIWLSIYTNFYFIVWSMGYRLDYAQVVVVSIIMVPLTLLPVQGLANLGTHELGWVAGLTLVGQSPDDALIIAVGSHLILLAFVLALGGIGFLMSSSVNREPPVQCSAR